MKRLSHFGAGGVTLRIDHRVVRASTCRIWLLTDKMEIGELVYEGKRTKRGWQLQGTIASHSDADFNVLGKPRRSNHGLSLILDENGETIAEIDEDEKRSVNEFSPQIVLTSAGVTIDFSLDDDANGDVPGLVGNCLGQEVGRFWIHSLDAGALSLSGRSDLDIRVVAAACLDFHEFFASSGKPETLASEFLSDILWN